MCPGNEEKVPWPSPDTLNIDNCIYYMGGRKATTEHGLNGFTPNDSRHCCLEFHAVCRLCTVLHFVPGCVRVNSVSMCINHTYTYIQVDRLCKNAT